MNKDTSNDDEIDREQTKRSPNLPRAHLLKRIYYPDTLYPDKYIFFANRKSRSIDINELPTTTTTTTNTSTLPKQTTFDSELIENQRNPSIMSLDDQHGIETSQSVMLDRERGETDSERRFDFKRYLPSALRAPDKTQPPSVLLDIRFYTLKKTAMTILCLLIIIMSNSVQLKHVLKQGSTHPFYSTQVFLGIISVLLCACIGLILMYVMRIDLNDQYKQYKLDYIDNAVICLLFILTIFNIFIAACN